MDVSGPAESPLPILLNQCLYRKPCWTSSSFWLRLASRAAKTEGIARDGLLVGFEYECPESDQKFMHWRGILELDKHCPQVQVDQDTSRVDHCRFSTSTGIFTDIDRAYSFAEKGHRT